MCLSCHCTHAGCYATVFVLSLHACWMLRNCVCLVIARMLDDATVFVLSLHTCWMLRNCVCLVIARMLDDATVFVLSLHACWMTQLCLSCHCTHAGCYATVFVLSLHACWMLRNCVCLVIARMLDATQRNWPTKQTMPENGEKRRLFFGGWFQYARIPSKTPL